MQQSTGVKTSLWHDDCKPAGYVNVPLFLFLPTSMVRKAGWNWPGVACCHPIDAFHIKEICFERTVFGRVDESHTVKSDVDRVTGISYHNAWRDLGLVDCDISKHKVADSTVD